MYQFVYCMYTCLCMSAIQTHFNLTDVKTEKEKKNQPSMNFMQLELQQVFYITVI